MLKKIILVILIVAAFAPLAGLAADTCTPNYSGSKLCNAIPTFGGKTVNDIPGFIMAALSWLASIIGTLALIMVIFSGAQMVFSRGEPQAVTRAKTSLTYSIIGLATVLFAYVIVSGVQYFIGFDEGSIQPGQSPGNFFLNPLRDTSLLSFFETSALNFLTIIGAATILFIILSGFRYITSGGNEEQAKKARAGLTWAIIGLISIILSYVIVVTVLNTIMGAQIGS
jgi:hypothetical protein